MLLSMVTISPKVFRALSVVVFALVGFATLWRLPNTSTRLGNSNSYLASLPRQQVKWSRFAYTQYATNRSYLCNSLMIFEALHRLGSKADRVLMYPHTFLLSEDDASPEARLLRSARDDYVVKLKPVNVMMKGGGGGKSSRLITKLRTNSERSTVVRELHKAPHV